MTLVHFINLINNAKWQTVCLVLLTVELIVYICHVMASNYKTLFFLEAFKLLRI